MTKHTNTTIETRENNDANKTQRDKIESDKNTTRKYTTEGCPECEGNVYKDPETSEFICEGCGLVIQSDTIDRGPDWRNFSEDDNKSRVGAPTTNLMHDKGLSTTISWQDKDASGTPISADKREQMNRLRTWNTRYTTTDSKDRNLKEALSEISRMSAALGLSKQIQETASVIYRQALDGDLLPGRSIEGVATASLYAATRQCSSPRSLDEFENVSRVEKMEYSRTYRYICRELGLEIEPNDPREYIPRFISNIDKRLNNEQEIEQKARDLVKNAQQKEITSGRAPTSLAAAAIYASGILTEEKMTQTEISEASNVTEVTIRNRYQEMLEVYP